MDRTIRSIAVLAASTTMACCGLAQAQQPAPAVTAAAPPMNCPKPADFKPAFDSGEQMARFTKRLEEYKTCVGDYSRTNGAKANELALESRVYADAANKAIDDYNAYVIDLNAKTNKSAADSQAGAPVPTPPPKKY